MIRCENCGREKGEDAIAILGWCPHSIDGRGNHVFTDREPLTLDQWNEKRAEAYPREFGREEAIQVHDRQFEDPDRSARGSGIQPVDSASPLAARAEPEYARVTDDAPEEIKAHLRAAYEFVSSLIPTPPILDIGSGDGWGAMVMRGVGFDPHEPEYPIPWFRGRAPWDLQMVAEKSFGTVTCFQTIEHVARHWHVPLIAEMQRISNGDIFISTVNKDVDPNVLGVELYVGEKNECHLHEYSVEAFHLLEVLFPSHVWDVSFYWQREVEFTKWNSDMKIEVLEMPDEKIIEIDTEGQVVAGLQTFPVSMLLWARRKQPQIPIAPGEVEAKT